MNNTKKFIMTLFVVLFLLMIALVIYAITGTADEREYYNTHGTLQTITPPPTVEPTPLYNPSVVVTGGNTTVISSPIPVITPQPTPEPTPTPVPTPEPTAPSIPAGTVLNSGSCSSTDEYKLKIRADWTATVLDEEHVTVQVKVFALHYKFYCGSFKTLFVDFNNEEQNLTVPDITYDKNEYTETELGTADFVLQMSTGGSISLPLNVRWNFGGTYGKDANGNPQQIDTLTCNTIVEAAR